MTALYSVAALLGVFFSAISCLIPAGICVAVAVLLVV